MIIFLKTLLMFIALNMLIFILLRGGNKYSIKLNLIAALGISISIMGVGLYLENKQELINNAQKIVVWIKESISC